MALMRYIDDGREPTHWRHDVDVIAQTENGERMTGENAVGDMLHRNTQNTRCRTERGGAPRVVTGGEAANDDMLTRRESVVGGKVGWNRERQRYRIVGKAIDGRHLKSVKLRVPRHS